MYYLSPFSKVTNCHVTTPAATEILSECLAPHCGISIQPSERARASSLTPVTSLPSTSAMDVQVADNNCFLSISGSKTLLCACSTLQTLQP